MKDHQKKSSSAPINSSQRFINKVGILTGTVLLSGSAFAEPGTDKSRTVVKPDKPNLLFIWTDEQRRDTLECYGNKWLKMPNLNRLASKSVVFDRAYVSQPVCTPSRATVLTGLYPHTHGCTSNNIPLRKETRTIAEMVDPSYACGYIGKWHLGDEISAQHGFTHWRSIADMYRKYYSDPACLERFSDYHHFLVRNGFKPDKKTKDGKKIFSRIGAAGMPEKYTKAAFCANEAVDFIKKNKNKPFLLHVNIFEPHMPFTGPLNNTYDPSKLPVGPTFLRQPPVNASLRNRLAASWFKQTDTYNRKPLKGEAQWRRTMANYYGMVTMVDNAVGRILKALEQSGQADNTIIVFTSDHGDQMGNHHILAKCVMYEESVTVPCFIYVPWMKSCRIAGAFSQVDLTPTLLDLMGQPVPSHIQGVSRVKEMKAGSSLEDNPVFIEWNGNNGTHIPAGTPGKTAKRVKNQPWRTVVYRGWKLNLSPVDQCELYNLKDDPYEQVNLYHESAQKGRIKKMTMLIKQWQKKTGDGIKI